MFQDKPLVEGTAAAGVIVVVLVAQWRNWRGSSKLGIPPIVLPLWFAAELVAASAPGEYYGHHYMPFVPICACAAAMVLELCIPKEPRLSYSYLLRVTACVVLMGGVINILDARYRADPMKYWLTYAPGAHLPTTIINKVADDAKTFGWHSYVPLDTMATHVLLDMPLKPGTRFLVQYQYQFQGPESLRGSELLADLSRADVVVEDLARYRLDRELESRIRTTLRSSFTPFLKWSGLQFYARTGNSNEQRPTASPQ
jgi:hypothetical protein